MAGDQMPTDPLPPPGWDVAAAGAAARGVDRSPQFFPQSFEPERLCVDRGLVAGGIATRRSLSAVGDIGRARLGKDSPIKAAQGIDRPQCRPRTGPFARRT